MSVVGEQQIKNDIKNGCIACVYFVFGDDGYLKKQAVEKLSQTACSKDDPFNYHFFHGECDLQNVYDAIEQLPLMADKKCVILKDYNFEKCDKTDFDFLINMCENGVEETLFILWFDALSIDAKKNEKVKKLITATEKSGGRAVCISHRSIAELAKMLCDGAAKRGCTLKSENARYMIETVGEDIDILVNELEKLCAFAIGSEITKQTIDEVCIRSIEQSVYNISGEILKGNVGAAVKILDDLIFMRVNTMQIFSTIASVYVDLCRASAAAQGKVSLNDAVKDFSYGNRSFLLERAMRTASKMNNRTLSLSLKELMNADSRIKSFSGNDRLALEELIVRLSYIAAEGESID